MSRSLKDRKKIKGILGSFLMGLLSKIFGRKKREESIPEIKEDILDLGFYWLKPLKRFGGNLVEQEWRIC